MAEGWSVAAANAALNEVAGDYTWIKKHIGAPGSAGTSNPASDTTRKQATWGAAASGAITNSGDITWTDVPASEDYTHFSAWSAESGGTFGFSGTLTGNAVVTGDDYTIPAGDLDVTLTTAS